VESNQDGSDETRIDELDFFGTLAQSYGNRRASDVFEHSVMITVPLAISAVCKNRTDCSQESVRRQWDSPSLSRF